MPRLRLTGTILVILGGVVFLVALTFLPYLSLHVRDALILRRTEPTLWDVTTREPVILTVLAVAAIGAAAGDLLSGERALLVLATGFSFYLLGRIFPLDIPDYGFLARECGLPLLRRSRCRSEEFLPWLNGVSPDPPRGCSSPGFARHRSAAPGAVV
jgi:hypothetical protein